MQQLKKMLSVGVSLPTAIKECLAPMSIAAFAEKYGRRPEQISNVINGNWKATDADVNALVSEFGGTPDEWKLLLWESSKPTASV